MASLETITWLNLSLYIWTAEAQEGAPVLLSYPQTQIKSPGHLRPSLEYLPLPQTASGMDSQTEATRPPSPEAGQQGG